MLMSLVLTIRMAHTDVVRVHQVTQGMGDRVEGGKVALINHVSRDPFALMMLIPATAVDHVLLDIQETVLHVALPFVAQTVLAFLDHNVLK